MNRWWLLFLFSLMIGHTVCRSIVWRHLEVDEPEQIMLVQTLSLGYGTQPPLYTWLLYPLVQIFGASVVPLTILRLTILATVLYLVYAAARELCTDQRVACLATMLVLCVSEVYENFVGRWTHTMLLVAFTLATLLIVLRMRLQRRVWHYIVLGVLMGLGMQTKYNYLHFAAALTVALLAVPAWRTVVLDRRMLLSLAIAAVLLAPHAWWVLQHWTTVRGGPTQYTMMRAARYATWFGTFKTVGSNVVSVLFRELGLLLVPAFVLLPAFRNGTSTQLRDTNRLLSWLLASSVVIVGLIMLTGKIVHLRSHWLLPFTVLVPMWFLARLPLQQLTLPRYRTITVWILMVGFGVLGFRFAVTLRHTQEGCYWARERMVMACINKLEASGWEGNSAIVDNMEVGAFLRVSYPQARVACHGVPEQPEIDTETGVLLATVSCKLVTGMGFDTFVRQTLGDGERGSTFPVHIIHEPTGLSEQSRQLEFAIVPPRAVVPAKERVQASR